MSGLVMMALMFGVFYFLIIRPQSKKAKEHARMLDGLQSGDRVITRGGIIGKVTGVKDGVLIIEIQEKVRVSVLKSFIEGKYVEGATSAATASKSEASASSKS